MGLWLPFCENVTKLWLYERKKKKNKKWNGFLLTAEWNCESFLFLPKPHDLDLTFMFARLPLSKDSGHYHYVTLCSLRCIWNCLLTSLPAKHSSTSLANTPFLQVSPHSPAKPPSTIPHGKSIPSLECLWSFVRTTIRAAIFCGVWWIFLSAYGAR